MPAGTLAAYQSTLWWNLFANIFETGEGGVIGNKFLYEGLYYEIGNNNTVAVTSGDVKYSGDIEIPDHATFNGKTYRVVSIGDHAFSSSNITSVTIPNSVASIGEEAFYSCHDLTSVTIPNSVTSLDEGAFSHCSGLTSLTIPNSVTKIGDKAFYYCSGLTSVVIPNGVTSIGGDAFGYCSSLTSVIIPNSVTSIGGGAFLNCSLKTIYSEIKKPFEILTSVFDFTGILFVPAGSLADYQSTSAWNKFTSAWNKNATILEINEGGIAGLRFVYEGLCYEIGDNNTVTLISRDVKYSGDIDIPDHATFNGKTYSVTSIGSYAFRDCSGLTSVTIPNSVTLIDESAFTSCSGLTSVTIPNSVTSIGRGAFAYCSSLPSIIIPNSVTSIGSYAFDHCTALTSINIPNSVTSIGMNAFWYCSSLTSINIPNSVTSIDDFAFEGCSSLSTVEIHCTEIHGWFSGLGIKELIIGDEVTSIGRDAFSECSGLATVTIPKNVTSIGYGAFDSCKNLTTVVIGSGVTFIGTFAFPHTNLKKTIWLTNTPPTGYYNASGEINYVSNDLFTSLNNTVKYQFLSSYFEVDGVRYVPVSMSERICDAIDCVYDKNVADLKITSTVLYSGVTMNVRNINPYLAFNNKYIKTSTIDINGELPDYAFANCSYLEKVIYGKNINRLGKGVFSGCSTLTSLMSLGKTSFPNEKCISNSINTIDDYAFNGCTAAKNIIITDCDTELKLGANKIIEEYNSGTGNSLFFDCPLDSVYIGRYITYNTDQKYGYSPFYNNSSLRAVKITDEEKEISENEFYGCTKLQKVIIGDGVTTFGDRAFSGCSSLKYFAFGTQVKTIGQEAFSDCTAMVEIDCKAFTPPFCGSQALDDINKWQCKLYVPIGSIGAYQGADQWKEFVKIEEGTGTIVIDDVLGDANGDGNINDDDIREIENYILSKPSAKFIFKNADANGDNVVNAADIVKVINIIKKI